MSPSPALSRILRPYVPRPLRRAVIRARFGDLRRIEPASEWGFSRGTPVDRWYIERFLEDNADLIEGHALEVKEDLYATRFGASSVDILDIDDSNSVATVVGDLCEESTLSPRTYDVAVVTQTLQLVPRPLDAVRHLLTSLHSGGSLILTVPSLSRLAGSWDRWRWTPRGMRDLLMEAAPPDASVACVGLGNSLAARAFLFGLAASDLDDRVLAVSDEEYPMVVAARVTLPS